MFPSAEGLARCPALIYPVGAGIDSLTIVYARIVDGRNPIKENRMNAQLTFTYLQQQQLTATPIRRVCDMPVDDQPLYRLHKNGANALASLELLTLALGGSEAHGLASDLLARFGSLHQLARASKAQLMHLRGIGEAQAARLTAIVELSSRLQEPAVDARPQVNTPGEAAEIFMPSMRYLEQEELRVMLLDTRNRMMGIHTITRGSLNSSSIRIGELFRHAIEAPAAAVIIAHNHPSGDTAPSKADVSITRKIVEAGELLDISVLDHLIIGNGRYASLNERKLGFD